MVCGWWGSVWCQAVAGTDLTPTLQDQTMCGCASETLGGLLRDDAIFKNTHMHACFFSVLSSLNLVKLFQLGQGFARVKHLMAKNIRPSCCSAYWTYAVIQLQ